MRKGQPRSHICWYRTLGGLNEVHFTAKLLLRQPEKNTVFVFVNTERADDILCLITIKFAYAIETLGVQYTPTLIVLRNRRKNLR